jgi:hypothetical protein
VTWNLLAPAGGPTVTEGVRAIVQSGSERLVAVYQLRLRDCNAEVPRFREVDLPARSHKEIQSVAESPLPELSI